jgi:two-component system NtrC family sensor kinase
MSFQKIKMSKLAIEVKSKYLNPFCYVFAVVGIFYAYMYSQIFLSNYLAIWCAVSAISVCVLLLIQKKINNHYVTANLAILLYFIILSILIIYGGGTASNSIWWLGTIPLAAAFLLNAFFGVIWFSLVMITFFLINYMGHAGLLPPNSLINAPTESRFIFSFIVNSSMIMVLCVLADSIRDKAFVEKEELRVKTFQLNQIASLGKLAAGVAHEINNPLTIIKGFQLKISRMLLSNENIDKKELAEYLAKMQSSIQRIQTVTSLMRTISDHDHDRKISQFSLNELVNDALLMLHNDIEKASIVVDVSLPSEPVFFNGIYNEMFQAIFNIIENAIQELNEKVGNRIVSIKLKLEPKNTVFLIEDNGRGISPEARNYIFDPFFTSKNVGVGRGMGLRFSLNTFISNGGNLELLADPEKTIFKATLPLNQTE